MVDFSFWRRRPGPRPQMKPNRPPVGVAVEGTGRARRRCGRMWMGHAQLRVVRRLSAPPKQASKQASKGGRNEWIERAQRGGQQPAQRRQHHHHKPNRWINPQTSTHTHTHARTLLASTHLPVAAGAAGGAHLRAGLHARGLHVPAARPRAFVRDRLFCHMCVYVGCVGCQWLGLYERTGPRAC